MSVAYGRYGGQLLVQVVVLPVLTVCLCLHSFSCEDTRHWPSREPTLVHRTELCLKCLFPHEALTDTKAQDCKCLSGKAFLPTAAPVLHRWTLPFSVIHKNQTLLKVTMQQTLCEHKLRIFSVSEVLVCFLFVRTLMCVCVCVMLRTEPLASHMLSKCFATEVHIHPFH